MPRKKVSFDKEKKRARRVKLRRLLETESEKEIRRFRERMRVYNARLNETEQQRQRRLEAGRLYVARKRRTARAKESKSQRQCPAEDLNSFLLRHQQVIFLNNIKIENDQTVCGMSTNPVLNPIETIVIENQDWTLKTKTNHEDNLTLGENKIEKEATDTEDDFQHFSMETSHCNIKTEIDIEDESFRITEGQNIKIEPNWEISVDPLEDPLKIDGSAQSEFIVKFEKPYLCGMETATQTSTASKQFTIKSAVDMKEGVCRTMGSNNIVPN